MQRRRKVRRAPRRKLRRDPKTQRLRLWTRLWLKHRFSQESTPLKSTRFATHDFFLCMGSKWTRRGPRLEGYQETHSVLYLLRVPLSPL